MLPPRPIDNEDTQEIPVVKIPPKKEVISIPNRITLYRMIRETLQKKRDKK